MTRVVGESVRVLREDVERGRQQLADLLQEERTTREAVSPETHSSICLSIYPLSTFFLSIYLSIYQYPYLSIIL